MIVQNPEKLDKTSDSKPKRDKKGRLLPGNTANLLGRPKRSWSIRDKFWQRFEKKPEELKAFLDRLLRDQPGLVWRMLEGDPTKPIELGGELPFQIIEIGKMKKDEKK